MAKKIGIILLIFVCFYMGAHYFIRWRNTSTDDVNKISKLVECDPNEVRGIKIISKKDAKETTLDFSRTDTPRPGIPSSAQLSMAEWKFQAPLKGEADAAIMTRFASIFCDLYDPVPARPEEFTPDAAPVDRVVLSLLGGKEPGAHTLRIGKSVDGRMVIVRYQNPSGAERTVKIPSNLSEMAALKAGDYLNLRVMRMAPDNINVATVYKKSEEAFRLERSGDGWKILSGGKEIGNGSAEATKYVNRLSTLRALKVDNEALNPAACERNQSRISVEFSGVNDRKEAVFFQYGKTGPVTVCNTSREALFSVHRDIIPYIEEDISKLTAR